MHDIVYVLRKGIAGDELRYSLRSLANFPHGKVVFIGGVPEIAIPDIMIPLEQRGVSVYQKTRYTIAQACKHPEISENFWLFNDDFFVMRKADFAEAYYDRTLYRRIQQIKRAREGLTSLYTVELERTRAELQEAKLKTINYETHTPMLINKAKMLEALGAFPRSALVRSVYGNYWHVGGEQLADPKISSLDVEPKGHTLFLSTNDDSFAGGRVGEIIRDAFPEKCDYEI